MWYGEQHVNLNLPYPELQSCKRENGRVTFLIEITGTGLMEVVPKVVNITFFLTLQSWAYWGS